MALFLHHIGLGFGATLVFHLAVREGVHAARQRRARTEIVGGMRVELATGQRVVMDAREDIVQIEHLLPALQLRRAPAAFTPAGNLREARLRFEREYIAAVLQHHGWRMMDAAQALGIQRPNLYRKARQLGIPLTRVAD